MKKTYSAHSAYPGCTLRRIPVRYTGSGFMQLTELGICLARKLAAFFARNRKQAEDIPALAESL